MDCRVQGNTSSTTKGAGKAASMAPRTLLLSKAAAAPKKPVLVSPLSRGSKPTAGLQQETGSCSGTLCCKARAFTGLVHGCCRARGDPSALQSSSPAGCRNGANIPLTTANCLQITLQAQPPQQQLPRVPKQMLPGPQAAQGDVSRHLHLPGAFLPVSQSRVCIVAVSPGEGFCPQIPKSVSLH